MIAKVREREASPRETSQKQQERNESATYERTNERERNEQGNGNGGGPIEFACSSFEITHLEFTRVRTFAIGNQRIG